MLHSRGRLWLPVCLTLESKSADTDSISHAYQNLCMTEQCKEPANSAITSKPSIQNSPISSRLLLNVLGVDSMEFCNLRNTKKLV